MNACNKEFNDIMDGGDDEHLTRDSSQSSCSNNEKVANTIDADESHKLLMQLDDEEQINDSNNKCTSRNHANRKSGHNDIIEFDLTNALVSPTNPFRLDLVQFERCRSTNTNVGETTRIKPNNKNINSNISINGKQQKHNSISQNDRKKISELVHLTDCKNRYNDIKYQRNSKSLGYLMLCKRIECNCSSSSSCNCLMRVNSLELRRTKSSTGINHCKWSNEMDNKTNSDETFANFNVMTNKSYDNSMTTNNTKIMKTATTNKTIVSRHSTNATKRNNFKECADFRPASLRLSQQKPLQLQQTKTAIDIKTDLVNCDSQINAKHPLNDGINDTKVNNNNLQANAHKTSKQNSSNGHRNNNTTIVNNDADIFSLNSKACADKTIDGCESVERGGGQSATAMRQLLANDNWKSNDDEQSSRSIIEKWSSHNMEHDLVANALRASSSTNPFLEQGTNVAESRVSKNSNGKEANYDGNGFGGETKRCEMAVGVTAQRNDKIHASNDVEETISNQFITNDDTISATCKSIRLSASGDNDRNVVGENVKRDLYYSESCSSRPKNRQKHDRMANNLLEYENDNDDSNQWDAGSNRSATLMKYGNKKRRRKDVNKDERKHNHSIDNLSLIDGTGHHHMRYAEQNKLGRNKAYYYDKNQKCHATSDNSSQKNLNYFNELDQQLINDDKQDHRQTHAYAIYKKNQQQQQQQIMSAMSDIPTCPFQRQDYTKPDNEHQTDASHTHKKSKKDLLLSFALQKGKYLSNTISRSGMSESASDCNGIRKAGNYMKTVNISNNSIPGAARTLTNAATITHVSGKGSYLKKLNVGYANRLVSSSNTKPHSFHFRHKDDKTYFDKTKKSLLKIGQKCGLKLNNSLSGGIPTKKFESSSLREPLTALDRDGYRHTIRPVIVEKVPYKSYRSEMDLTKNLHYLDAFLNENFDKLSKPKEGSHSIGKCSMPMSSSRERKSLNAMTFNDFHRRSHHRTQSVSEMSEFDGVDDTYPVYRNAGAATAGAQRISDSVTMENSLENNYTTTDTMSSALLKREFLASSANNSVGYRTPSINDNLNSIGQHHQPNQYVISSSTSESFSFKQHSLPNQSPNQCNPTGAIGVTAAASNQKFTFSKESPATSHANAIAMSSCERSAKSQTTSSSLSSSDYASVYSPNSEKHYQTQTTITKLNNELSLKQKRYPPISSSSTSAQYQKRNSFTGADLMYDDRPTAANYLTETRPMNSIDGLAIDSIATDSDSDEDGGNDENDDDVDDNDGDNEENVANNFNDFNESGNYSRNISYPDKLQLLEKSLYQYENKLPYHEDYLQHYYSKSGSKRASTSSASIQIQSQFPSMASSYPYSQESHLNYAQSTSNLPSGSTHPYYAQEVTIRKQPNYPQNRVVITKQKNNHSNSSDVVLEYEC